MLSRAFLRTFIFSALTCCLFASWAGASTITESFTIGGSGLAGSGTLTLTSTGDPNVDEITGISGSFSTTNGVGFAGSITGLNPGSYSSTNPTANSLSTYDNLFYPSQANATCAGASSSLLLDNCGLDFLVGGQYQVNLFGLGSGYLLSDGLIGGNAYVDSNAAATFATGITPEPSSFALLGTGVLAFVGAMRKRLA